MTTTRRLRLHARPDSLLERGMADVQRELGLPSAFPPEVETVRYRVGTANVDVVDLSKKQVVWEGIVEGRLTDKIMKDPRTAISNAITEMFLQYPARAAGG